MSDDLNGRRQSRRSTISNLFVETRQVAKAFARIDELIEYGWEDSSCRGMLLLGHSRVGKTHIVNNYIRMRVDEKPKEAKRPRIQVLEVPAGCTLRAFVTDVLVALDDPDPERGSAVEKTRRIAEAIKREELDLLVIDEVQRLIDADTDKVKRDVANWMTALLNKRLCPLLLVGERSAERVFEGSMHARGRTFGEELLKPHDWADMDDRREFRGILRLLGRELGLDEDPGLEKTETALRIYDYSEGLLGQAATLATQAKIIARRLKRPTLTHDILAMAVDELRIGEARRRPNPFRVDPKGTARSVDSEGGTATIRVQAVGDVA